MKKIIMMLLLCLQLEAKTALVTGGAGFLGSHLCEKLLENDYRVLCLDDLSTGSQENVLHLLNHPNFRFISQDVAQEFTIDEPLDEIYNMACAASPIHYQKDAIQTLKTNFLGCLHLLELAKANDAKIFQSSTSEVYGDPLQHPQKEEYWGNVNPNGPRSCYDEGKRVAESLFFNYHLQHGVRIKVGRIFNTYGPNMSPDDGRVVSNFIIQALQEDPITIYGDGKQTRSFCYVSDLIDGIYALMQTSDDVVGPINLGNPGEFTMIELAKKVIELTNSDSPLIFKSLPKDDPTRRLPDITKAKELLGWEPKVPLDEGLQKTIRYFKKIIEKPKTETVSHRALA